jgi:polyphosphate kinase 2 (PPK2 family)
MFPEAPVGETHDSVFAAAVAPDAAGRGTAVRRQRKLLNPDGEATLPATAGRRQSTSGR